MCAQRWNDGSGDREGSAACEGGGTRGRCPVVARYPDINPRCAGCGGGACVSWGPGGVGWAPCPSPRMTRVTGNCGDPPTSALPSQAPSFPVGRAGSGVRGGAGGGAGRRGRETGWAGGWWCRLRGGVRVSSSALRPSSAGGRPLRRRIPAPSSPPPDSLSVLWSPTQELALHFQELGKRSRKLECEPQGNHNAQGLGEIWSTEGSGYQCRASMPPTRNTTQEVCLTHL